MRTLRRAPVALAIGALFCFAAISRADDPQYDCACGCGIFDVATSSMLPRGPGGQLWFEYDYQDQHHNWDGSHSAPTADNDDRLIRTSFYTVGAQYMFNRAWGLEAELPTAYRNYRPTDPADVSTSWYSLGDMRVQGIYTGFFQDMSAGLTFGAKLPTGDFTHHDVDRDTQIGTGSTDALIGGFYRGQIGQLWTWFAQTQVDVPLFGRDHYIPGTEVDAALGVYYEGINLGPVHVAPVAQIINSWRAQDNGDNAANPVGSGFERIYLSPGLEFNFKRFTIYADAELPVYQHVTGDQLVAPVLLKVIFSYNF